MDPNPLISVIVPVYNVAEYLPGCIDRILAQTYSHLEVILVDDGSVDKSSQICDDYAKSDSRIVVVHKVNGGLSDARNAGLDIAKGDYVAFVDSDDLIHHRFVETLLSLCCDNGADIASVGFLAFDDAMLPVLDGNIEGRRYVFSSEDAIQSMLYQRELDNSVCNKLYRKRVIAELRFPKGVIYEDMALCYLLMEKARKIAHMNASLYYYRLREQSITGSFSLRRTDVLDITDTIVSHMARYHHRLLPAALDRKFAANMNILWLMTRSDIFDQGVEHRCWKNIKALRFATLCNPKSRLKNRVGALTAFLGKGFVKSIFRIKRHSR